VRLQLLRPEGDSQACGSNPVTATRQILGELMRRPEEILEIAEIIEVAADRLATVLERSGADELHPPQVLREIAHFELELAAADVAAWTFGTKTGGRHN
jgi:hypothetical protein